MQQKIFRLMPIMFTFFFLTFPSGLVIYWLVNTALGIAQQAYVNHQLGAAHAIIKQGPRGKHKKRPKGGVVKRKPRGKR
jgi:YidC/Oxa1 family membrane protein insertase